MRGTTLQELVEMFRDEVSGDSSPGTGTSAEDSIKRLLRRTQIRLYKEYDWPFLEQYFSKSLLAGERYYDIPTGLNLEEVQGCYFFDGDQWVELGRGIHLTDLNVHNSDKGERVSPALKWDVYQDLQFEVWPIPAIAGEVRFYGKRQLNPLVNWQDRADLDDDLIVLFAGAEWLSRYPKRMNEAQSMSIHARNHLSKIKGGLSTTPVMNMADTTPRAANGRAYGVHNIYVRG